MNYDIKIKGIDLNLLREQKDTLLNLQWKSDGNGTNFVNSKEFLALEGIISLIDHIQDEAVEQHGLDENEVFNLNKEE
jgi:hypothetical protein